MRGVVRRLRERVGPPVVDPWPPPVRDRFADVSGLPEVHGDRWSAEDLTSAIAHHGALLVRGALPSESVLTLAQAVEAAFSVADGDQELPDGDEHYRPCEADPRYGLDQRRAWMRDSGALWMADAPTARAAYAAAIGPTTMVANITEHLGGAVLTVNKTTLRKVGPDVQTSWHQDGAFMGTDLRTVNAWIPLTPCGGAARVPGLDVLPKRIDHVVETGTGGALIHNGVGPDTVTEVAAGTAIARPEFEPGDALLFDELFLHSSGVSPDMHGHRLAIEAWYFSPDHQPPLYAPLEL